MFGYYPVITLYFRHNSLRLQNVHTKEWNNTDGTGNKEITITAEASDVPYTCVAADIPGSVDKEQVTSIFLHVVPDESTTQGDIAGLSTEESGSKHDWMIGK